MRCPFPPPSRFASAYWNELISFPSSSYKDLSVKMKPHKKYFVSKDQLLLRSTHLVTNLIFIIHLKFRSTRLIFLPINLHFVLFDYAPFPAYQTLTLPSSTSKFRSFERTNRPLQWRWELGSFGTTYSSFKSFSNNPTSLQSYISSSSPRSKTLPVLLGIGESIEFWF